MKALDKKRSRRYDTANAFAADISNYLHDAPVTACPPSAMYQLQKFLRRYKELAATLALVLATLLVGIVATSWQTRVALRERDRAVIAEDLADERLTAEQTARAAETAARSGDGTGPGGPPREPRAAVRADRY